MQYLKYNNKKYKIEDEYSYKKSNSEVTFNDVVIDFTDGTIDDIPFKYQECQIIKDDEIIFTGYVDVPKLAEMKTSAETEGRAMTLTILSPLKMATIRTVTVIGTFSVEVAIQRILQPLIDDGFTIKEMNISTGQVTLSLILQTVEYAMNNIGYKRNIFWFINEKKEIFVNSIDYLFAKVPAKNITEADGKDEGLYYMQPTISDIDYANIINFKNVRLIYSTFSDYGDIDYPIVEEGKTIKNGDSVTFKYPFILDEEYLRTVITDKDNEENMYYDLQLTVICEDGTMKNYTSGINLYDNTSTDYNKYEQTSNFSFDDDGGDEQEIVLQRDNFFTNLITGFKWNYDSNATIIVIRSDTTLRYTTMKFVYNNEIEKAKSILNTSGQIEKTIDYDEKWTTLKQLITYARSLMTQNSNTINEVVLKYDKNPNLQIGDIVNINKPTFFTVGDFAVNQISYNYYNENDEDWEITLKKSNLLSSYIDMFRPAEQQENNSDVESMILSEFLEENFSETHSIEDYANIEEKVINLAEEAWINEGYDTDGLSFVIMAEVATNYYAVVARDAETSASVGWIYVNSETGECEVEY